MLNPHFDLPFRFSGSIPQATNILINGGFEVNAYGWRDDNRFGGAGAFLPSTDHAAFGTHSLKCIAAASFPNPYVYPVSEPFYGLYVKPNTMYTVSAYFYTTRPGVDIRYDLSAWAEDDSTPAGDYPDQSANPLPVGVWTRIRGASFPTNEIADHAYCLAICEGLGAGNTIYMDGWQVEEGPNMTPYIDTNGVPASRTGNVSAAVTEQNSFQEIANCVEAIVRTPLGFRDDAPDFGFPDLTMLEQPIINKDIVELVQSQEPRSDVLISEAPDALDALIDRLTVEVS